MSEPTNTDDIIDSRDVIARISELDGERDSLQETLADARTEAEQYIFDDEETEDRSEQLRKAVTSAQEELDSWEAEYGEELKTLLALEGEAEGCSDWRYGATLIRDSYFKEYAQELADELGYTNREMHWPHTYIDWERAAEDLQQDYTSVDFDGVTYWVRS